MSVVQKTTDRYNITPRDDERVEEDVISECVYQILLLFLIRYENIILLGVKIYLLSDIVHLEYSRIRFVIVW